MALWNTYGTHNRSVEEGLSTTWRSEKVQELELMEPGRYSRKSFWKYTRFRSKKFTYHGMTRSVAEACAEDLNRLFNRRLVPQVWNPTAVGPTKGEIGQWKSPTNPTQYDYGYKSCGRAVPSLASGDDWKVEVVVDEELEYRHEAVTVPYAGTTPDTPRWLAFEMDPSNSSFDSYFSGIAGKLDYGEGEDS